MRRQRDLAAHAGPPVVAAAHTAGRLPRRLLLRLLLLLLFFFSLTTPDARAAAAVHTNVVARQTPANAAVSLTSGDAAEVASVSNIVQLSEAVLAPAWGPGGFAYVVTGSGSSTPQAVCAHTRTSAASGAAILTAPFTFSMFDAQFSALYSVAHNGTTAGPSQDTSPLTASVVGLLDLGLGCYTSTTGSAGECAATLQSAAVQCALGEQDALAYNWTADTLASAVASATASAQPALARASGVGSLGAVELLAAFLSDYLPQRAWLRTAAPRSLDALLHAEQAAAVYGAAATNADGDAAEAADAQRAIAAQWGAYLWTTYVPALQRKWSLWYGYAVATLSPAALAPSSNAAAEVSVTGAPPSSTAAVAACPLVEDWPRLRYTMGQRRRADADPNATSLVSELAVYVGGTLDALAAELTRSAAGKVDAGSLLQRAFCAAVTHLFATAAVLDAPFLVAANSVWVQTATAADAWAVQTMRTASVKGALGSVSVIQDAVWAGLARLQASLPATAAEQAFVVCLAPFLNVANALTSLNATSPSECVQALVQAHSAASAPGDTADGVHVLWDVDQVVAASPDPAAAAGMLGIARYESSTTFPSTASPMSGEDVRWTLFQAVAVPVTGQPSLYTPHTNATVPDGICPASSRDTVGSAGQTAAAAAVAAAPASAVMCAAGTYAQPEASSCAVCPGACAVAGAQTSVHPPVYCPGHGLMHGCPALPDGSVLAGSPNAGLRLFKEACRYACVDVYQAPLRNGCVSQPGFFYNTTASISDARNGGWYEACTSPAALLPAPDFPSPARGGRVFAFVGSGTMNEPASCRFTLMHRVVSSSVSSAAVLSAGLQAPPTQLAVGSSGGVTWAAAVRLNATLLWQMHVSLRQQQQRQQQGAAASAVTAMGHALVALYETSESAAAQMRWSWYLVSAYEHPEADAATTPPASANFTLRLLLNVTRDSGSSATAASPAPSCVVALSAPWLWSVAGLSSDVLETATYRAVVSTTRVTFFVDGALLGDPVEVDWPVWAAPSTAPAAAAAATNAGRWRLSVSGWVAGYVSGEQWSIASPGGAAAAASATPLPLYFDYLPGVVARLTSVAAPVAPLQDALRGAEVAWRWSSAAASAAETQWQSAVALAAARDVTGLSRVVAVTPVVAANVSAALAALAVLPDSGLDAVCRSGYGANASAATASCVACPSGAYTVLNATADRNACACVPQRIASDAAASTSAALPQACVRRPAGPAAPSAHLREAGVLPLDATGRMAVALGWYGVGTDAPGGARPLTSSLAAYASCSYGLTTPRAMSAGALNETVELQHTTGLGGEECLVRAAARGRSSLVADGATQPAYTAETSFSPRLRAATLTAAALSLSNGTQLFVDQTVLTVSVRDYALLSPGAVQALEQVGTLTEYQAALLVYVLRCATVAAELRCGTAPAQEVAGRFTWAGNSSLASPVLRVSLAGVVTADCVVSLTVRSDAAPASAEAAVPFATWPYSYLATDANGSTFFTESPTYAVTLRPSAVAFATRYQRYDPLRESSSLVIAFVLFVVSVALTLVLLASARPPTLAPNAWRQYECAAAPPASTERHDPLVEERAM